ncbi:hypothetical protein NPIL_625521 [Nephila pilipes]|uniref:Uncharacterized protein n=1 Tax=Nephila pilipes TaxID=299642 RepID=A0A8X6PMV6_NEPPI|nr:hypothetical protein NPIL_625521 [Nephila pilipes]
MKVPTNRSEEEVKQHLVSGHPPVTSPFRPHLPSSHLRSWTYLLRFSAYEQWFQVSCLPLGSQLPSPFIYLLSLQRKFSGGKLKNSINPLSPVRMIREKLFFYLHSVLF